MNRALQEKRNRLPLVAALAAVSVLSVSCTATPVPPMELALASAGEQSVAQPGEQVFEETVSADTGEETRDVAGFATADPAGPVESALEATVARHGNDLPVVAETPEKPASEAAAGPSPHKLTAQGDAAAPEGDAVAADSPRETTQQEIADAVLTAGPAPVEAAPKQEKRGFLSALFGNREPRPKRALVGVTKPVEQRPVVVASAVATPVAQPQKPIVNTASANALPGVNAESLFEIKRKSGTYDDSDVDVNEGDTPVRVASVTGLARLAPNGLVLQRADVDVKCLKPALMRVLKSVERHYGKKVVVTSGYRSPGHNRKVRGARNSLHMYCAAADIQVEGVGKWVLASYLRSMPGRGGVGTYCHTNSVHVDIGPERDWNWRCRRKKKRR